MGSRLPVTLKAAPGAARALFLSVATCLLCAQGLPGIPGKFPYTEAPSVPELLPLRPFLFEEGAGEGRTLRWRGELVQESDDVWIIEKGAIQSDDLLLLADRITYEPRTGMLEALGRIRLEGPDLRLRCERLRMDWKNRIGHVSGLFSKPPIRCSVRGHLAEGIAS